VKSRKSAAENYSFWNNLREMVSQELKGGLMVTIRGCLVMLSLLALSLPSQAQQTPQGEVLRMTREWLTAISTGDRATLNRIMDARCLITTPVGDILSKDRLVPDDESRGVQTLPLMELSGPIVRVYADTAVLMTHLQPKGDGEGWVSTFVYAKQDSKWKLVALHAMTRVSR
jgi:hypothetical protein